MSNGGKKIVDCQPVVECGCVNGSYGRLQCDLAGNPVGCGCTATDAGPDSNVPADAVVAPDQTRADAPGGTPDVMDDLATAQTPDLASDPIADSAATPEVPPPQRDAAVDLSFDAPPSQLDVGGPELKKYDAPPGETRAVDVSTCIPETEWCDGKDNDCDGVIDNGHVCAENGVANAIPFNDGVYLQGTTSEGSCGADALQRFWPTREKAYYYGFDCYADLYQFRQTDWQLFYQATFTGILRDDSPTSQDTLVPTPPCGESVSGQFGFDGAGTIHYVCNGSIRRGNGESVTGASTLAAVLADGRMVVTRSGSSRFELVDPAGTTISTLDLSKEFVGKTNPLAGGCTVRGNDAFLLLTRNQGQAPLEMVVYRLTPDSNWLLVRRVTTQRSGVANLVISDGTVFVREDDPTSTFGERIVAFPPGGDETIVWREDEAPVVRAHIGDQMLVGPANAQGPSVKPE